MMKRIGWFWLVLVVLAAVTAVAQPGRAQQDTFIYLPVVHSPAAVLEPSLNLPVTAATYLGGAGADVVNGVAVAPGGDVVLVGAMPGYDPVTPVLIDGGGDGVVVRLAADGQLILSLTRLGDVVNDVAVGADGRILVCGDFGVALLDEKGANPLWQAQPGVGLRCDRGSDGMTAVLLAGGEVQPYDAAGAPGQAWAAGGSRAFDVAVAGDEGRVIVTGYDQKANDLQVAYMKAWSYAGALGWKAYDFSAGSVKGEGLGSDTQGIRVAMGQDGWLYFAGWTAGSTAVYTRDPQDVTVKLGGDRLIKTDKYNNPYNNSAKITWYGRFDAADGSLERGQFLLVRLSSDKGNTIVPYGVMADGDGRFYLVGETYASIHNRDQRQIAGQPVGPYSGGEAYLLVVSPDFSQRLIWTPFAASSGAGGSPAYGVGVRDGVVAVGVSLKAGDGSLITYNPPQETKGGDAEAYAAIWHPGMGRR